LAFKSGGMRPFLVKLQETLAQKRWLVMVAPKPLAQKKIRSGIGGIEKSMAMKSKQTDKEISKVKAFSNELNPNAIIIFREMSEVRKFPL
jgi:hypothetical protein